jgi:hypothetical protein
MFSIIHLLVLPPADFSFSCLKMVMENDHIRHQQKLFVATIIFA